MLKNPLKTLTLSISLLAVSVDSNAATLHVYNETKEVWSTSAIAGITLSATAFGVLDPQGTAVSVGNLGASPALLEELFKGPFSSSTLEVYQEFRDQIATESVVLWEPFAQRPKFQVSINDHTQVFTLQKTLIYRRDSTDHRTYSGIGFIGEGIYEREEGPGIGICNELKINTLCLLEYSHSVSMADRSAGVESLLRRMKRAGDGTFLHCSTNPATEGSSGRSVIDVQGGLQDYASADTFDSSVGYILIGGQTQKALELDYQNTQFLPSWGPLFIQSEFSRELNRILERAY